MVLKPSDKWGYFPLTKEFLQAPIDDIFYGYLFCQAAWDNKGKYCDNFLVSISLYKKQKMRLKERIVALT